MGRLIIVDCEAPFGVGAPSVGDMTALVSDCRELLSTVLPLANQEREFIAQLNDKGEILPGALTDDHQLRDIIRTHPGLLWKAQNVRQFRSGANEP